MLKNGEWSKKEEYGTPRISTTPNTFINRYNLNLSLIILFNFAFIKIVGIDK